MAYYNQERKAAAMGLLKTYIPSTWKWSLRVRSHMTAELTIYGSPNNLDNGSGNRHLHPGRLEEKEVLSNINTILNLGNHDRSDIQTDYFDVGWYVDINLGKYGKPYEVKGHKFSAKDIEEGKHIQWVILDGDQQYTLNTKQVLKDVNSNHSADWTPYTIKSGLDTIGSEFHEWSSEFKAAVMAIDTITGDIVWNCRQDEFYFTGLEPKKWKRHGGIWVDAAYTPKK